MQSETLENHCVHGHNYQFYNEKSSLNLTQLQVHPPWTQTGNVGEATASLESGTNCAAVKLKMASRYLNLWTPEHVILVETCHLWAAERCAPRSINTLWINWVQAAGVFINMWRCARVWRNVVSLDKWFLSNLLPCWPTNTVKIPWQLFLLTAALLTTSAFPSSRVSHDTTKTVMPSFHIKSERVDARVMPKLIVFPSLNDKRDKSGGQWTISENWIEMKS